MNRSLARQFAVYTLCLLSLTPAFARSATPSSEYSSTTVVAAADRARIPR